MTNDTSIKESIMPSWLKKGNYKIDLDKYYTNKEISSYCYKSLLKILKQYNVRIDDYCFLEPAAGDGSFLKILPKENRIGIDILPHDKEIIKQDFFDWKHDKNKKYITIGNPPFGARGWLALKFINEAALFSDVVAFILPMYFASDGKGSAKSRVKGLNLLHSEELPANIFHNEIGEPVKINTVWQVWGKMSTASTKQIKCDKYVEIYTVCSEPKRRCGLDKLDKYDCFISSTFYRTNKIVRTFDEVKYGSGYGLIIKKQKKKIMDLLNNTNWDSYHMRATNHCRHIGISHLVKRLADGGFTND